MPKRQKIDLDDPKSLRDRHLTPKQQAFVDNYCATLRAKQSAIDAGYSKKTADVIATENLSKPHIADAIARGMAKKEKKLQITPTRVLDNLLRLAEKAERTNQLNPAIRAHELIGKQIGMFSDRLQVDATTTNLVIHTTQPALKQAVLDGIQQGQQQRRQLTGDDVIDATADDEKNIPDSCINKPVSNVSVNDREDTDDE